VSWKEILVYIDGQSNWRPTAEKAAAVAARCAAHLVGLEAIHMPDRSDGVVRRGLGTEVLEQRRRDLEEGARRLGDEFLAWADTASVVAEWRVGDGEPAKVLAVYARYADVVVLGPPAPNTLLSLEAPNFVASVVLAAGRPILIAPAAPTTATLGTNVLVAWNASREATRAVADALPLIEGAARVAILLVRPKTGRSHQGPEPGADVAHYLARHGIDAEVIQLEDEHGDAGAVLLEHAARSGADLLVMGGYGHSRLRELVLGGATRTVLERASVPVLMSH
jgi:nucleotide-binding universal stress UspA family protein